MASQQYTFKDKEITYILDVESERQYNQNYERKEKLFERNTKRWGRLFTYDESLSTLKARGFERHLTPSEFSRIFLDTMNKGLNRESLEGVVKDIIEPQKAITPELEAEYRQDKYRKKNAVSRNADGHKIIDIKEPDEEMPQELYDRWKKASDHDELLRRPEFTSVMLTARAEPARIIAYVKPKNIFYDSARHKYLSSARKVMAKEIKEFPLKMKPKIKILRPDVLDTFYVQGFSRRLAHRDAQLPEFNLEATVKLLHKLCPDLVGFLWGYEYKRIEELVRKDKLGKIFLNEGSFFMGLKQEGDLVPLLIGSSIYSTPLSVTATNGHPTANSRGVKVLK